MEEKRPLTPEDPVDTETLEQLRRLQDTRQRLAESLLTLEQEKIQLLAAAKKVDDQRNRLFETLLVDRGLSPGTEIEIDAKTGRIKLLELEKPREKAAE